MLNNVPSIYPNISALNTASSLANRTSLLHESQHTPLANGMALLPNSSLVSPHITHLMKCPGVFIPRLLPYSRHKYGPSEISSAAARSRAAFVL
jgi:hypothetical protein